MDDAHLAVSSPPQTEPLPQPSTGSEPARPCAQPARRAPATTRAACGSGCGGRTTGCSSEVLASWERPATSSTSPSSRLLVKGADVHYRPAAVLAFCVAVTNNFLWNRHWTFKATRRSRGLPGGALPGRQPVRARFNLVVLELLVSVGGRRRRSRRRRSRSSPRRRSTSSATSSGASASREPAPRATRRRLTPIADARRLAALAAVRRAGGARCRPAPRRRRAARRSRRARR